MRVLLISLLMIPLALGCGGKDADSTTPAASDCDDGFGLAADWVIHTVGPVYDENDHQESCRLLQAAYQASLAEARDRGCRRIAFPAISTGAYQFPLPPAARIAISVAEDSLQRFCSPEQVLFVLFSQPDWDFFQTALG